MYYHYFTSITVIVLLVTGYSLERSLANSRSLVLVCTCMSSSSSRAVICVHVSCCVQNKVALVSTVQLSIFLMSPFVFHFFVKGLGWGLFGAAMAINATSLATVLCMLVSIEGCRRHARDNKQSAWHGFSIKAFKVGYILLQLCVLRIA
jgi:hypothetical protein